MPFIRCHVTRSLPPSRTPVCHLYDFISRDGHLRPGHLNAIYTMSYHEIATSVPDTCMPFIRCHITRSPPPSRTPVCHLHNVISRDPHLRPGHLYAIYTMSYHEIAPPSRTPVCHLHDVISRDRTSVPDTCMPFTQRHIPKDWNPYQQCYESLRSCMIFRWLDMIIVKQKATNAPTEVEHS